MGAFASQRRMYTEPSLAKTWLSDPATYPIMVVVAGAVGVCCSFMTYKITCDPSVRITKGYKGQVIRTWGGSK